MVILPLPNLGRNALGEGATGSSQRVEQIPAVPTNWAQGHLIAVNLAKSQLKKLLLLGCLVFVISFRHLESLSYLRS